MMAQVPSLTLPLGWMITPDKHKPNHREATDWIARHVRSAGSSFYWGMRLLPKQQRETMFALYAFAHAVDDIADEQGEVEQKRAGLKAWRDEIARLYPQSKKKDTRKKFDENENSEPCSVIGLALAKAIQTYDLQEQDFLVLIDGMESDAFGLWAGPERAAFERYCDQVAGSIGRHSIRIFAAPEFLPESLSDTIALTLGRAFQITNILRDLGEDAARGRLYLPADLLQHHQIASRDPIKVLTDPNLPNLCRDLLAEAGAYFDQASQLMAKCPPATIRPVQLMQTLYYSIWCRLKQNDFQQPATRLSVSKLKRCWAILPYLF